VTDVDKYYCVNWKLIFGSYSECFDWLINYGFRGIKFSMPDLCKAINGTRAYRVKSGWELNANFPNEPVVNLLRHFSEHYWHSFHKDYLPISKAWDPGNRMVLKTAVENLWNDTREINIYGLVKYITKYFKDFSSVSLFKPWIARYLYEKYLPNGGTIVDPCMGWGGRFLATIDSKYNYIGYDLNPLCIESHKHLRKFLGSRVESEPQFINSDSSEVDFIDGDLLFTSPPYDDTEYYYGLNKSDTLTRVIISNIMKKFRNLIALNIPKRQRDMCIDVANEYGRVLTDEVQMKTASFMGREKCFEPILIFK
jgi:hypothetical protein